MRILVAIMTTKIERFKSIAIINDIGNGNIEGYVIDEQNNSNINDNSYDNKNNDNTVTRITGN